MEGMWHNGVVFPLACHGSEKWNISCHISKQMMSQSSMIVALQHELVNPEEMECWKEYLPSSSYQTAATPRSHSLWWDLKKLRMWKYRTLAPESWGAYQRNDFSEPRLLHLLIHRKVLNSLTQDTWFSLINNYILMFRLPALCYKTSI